MSTPEPIAKTEIQDENLFVGLWRESCEVYENRESYSFKVLVSEDGSYTETIDEFHDDLNCNPSYLSRTQMIQGRIEPGTQYANGSIDIDIIPQRFFYAFRDDVKRWIRPTEKAFAQSLNGNDINLGKSLTITVYQVMTGIRYIN